MSPAKRTLRPSGSGGGQPARRDGAAHGHGGRRAHRPMPVHGDGEPARPAVVRAGGEAPEDAAEAPPSRSRRVRLRISKADPWSVMATSFLVLLGLGASVVATVAVGWSVLSGLEPGTWPPMSEGLAFTGLIVMLEVVLGTALATLVAFLYNMTSDYVGGVEVTLDDEVSALAAGPESAGPDVPGAYGAVAAERARRWWRERYRRREGDPPPVPDALEDA
ncbi:DUF3566 domain-containing protein [Streptomyces sp. NPDC046831]|uniref:DUF3566 domain-containing protein n=1 Tax=Streptomyces sp. NPDC046831 TaxID=3154805 RepID=UPI0033CE7DD1